MPHNLTLTQKHETKQSQIQQMIQLITDTILGPDQLCRRNGKYMMIQVWQQSTMKKLTKPHVHVLKMRMSIREDI